MKNVHKLSDEDVEEAVKEKGFYEQVTEAERSARKRARKDAESKEPISCRYCAPRAGSI